MHEGSLIRVEPVKAWPQPALEALHVSESQRRYVGRVADMLADAAVCPGSEAMTIVHDNTVIGCYRIDDSARSVSGRDFDQPALGLRSFFIDRCWQGRGFGRAAMDALITDAMQRHRYAGLLVLTVHTTNTIALKLYRRAGFTDNGELYHGGHGGPQHLLLRSLP
ncbi:GNAT family N-acetyltransferase [Rhodanobacter sp. L36]|uniref:GNAT family N-acetyltransferase n=1 Tax=Rhodanobacter sp. L36 TaxID=1747221 RepID=UPI00131E58AB|nr:GNAT family N-acetyltransferase [Rhodanobacter sp. L36]